MNARTALARYEIHRALKVTQKTAWFMLHRIRLCSEKRPTVANQARWRRSSEVEIDETFVGGRKKNMHKEKKIRYEAKRRGITGKTAVHGHA